MSEFDASDPEWTSETYTKQQVNELIADMYESIMLEVKEIFYANTKTSYFIVSAKNKYSSKRKYQIIDSIYSGLVGLDLVPANFKEDWHKLFSGEEIIDSITSIKWNRPLNLCPYLIFRLANDFHFITNINLHKKMAFFFGVKGTAQKVNDYNERGGKPKRHELIDNMLSFIEFDN